MRKLREEVISACTLYQIWCICSILMHMHMGSHFASTSHSQHFLSLSSAT